MKKEIEKSEAIDWIGGSSPEAALKINEITFNDCKNCPKKEKSFQEISVTKYLLDDKVGLILIGECVSCGLSVKHIVGRNHK